jgi:hypothetical protein
MYNYLNDKYGKICLTWAQQCKTDVGFGAVLVKGRKIIGQGRNRLATDENRAMLSHVDYAIHSEQAAIVDAIKNGWDVNNGKVYVLGVCLAGKNKGRLTTRTEPIFVCRKCPHTFIRYNITVNIPHVDGWCAIAPEKSLEIGRRLANKGYWKDFCSI